MFFVVVLCTDYDDGFLCFRFPVCCGCASLRSVMSLNICGGFYLCFRCWVVQIVNICCCFCKAAWVRDGRENSFWVTYYCSGDRLKIEKESFLQIQPFERCLFRGTHSCFFPVCFDLAWFFWPWKAERKRRITFDSSAFWDFFKVFFFLILHTLADKGFRCTFFAFFLPLLSHKSKWPLKQGRERGRALFQSSCLARFLKRLITLTFQMAEHSR